MALPAAINPRRFKDLDIDLRNVWIQTFIVNPSPNDAGWALWHELLQYIIAGHDLASSTSVITTQIFSHTATACAIVGKACLQLKLIQHQAMAALLS